MKPDLLFRQRVPVRPDYLLASGFGAGLLPWMPGTWGTLVGAGLWLLVLHGLAPLLQLSVVGLALLVGVAVCGRVTRQLAVEDYQGIVWDEIVGYWVTMLGVPGVLLPGTVEAVPWTLALTGFALFRLFDITKPWPIRSLERRVQGGWGVMLDDVLAGVYAGAVLYAGARFAPLVL